MMNFLSDVLLIAPAPTEPAGVAFDPGKFLEMLPYMGIGMLTIFVVIGVIILTTVVINKLFSKKQ